jgi:hypothetical protein
MALPRRAVEELVIAGGERLVIHHERAVRVEEVLRVDVREVVIEDVYVDHLRLRY